MTTFSRFLILLMAAMAGFHVHEKEWHWAVFAALMVIGMSADLIGDAIREMAPRSSTEGK
jgi:ABC-type dipeptide/oligopeptide/nickel transport system permease subunit